MRVLGVDGAKGGWVVVALEDGRFVDSRLVERFAEIVTDPAAVIGVDIPLGETNPGARRAEECARPWVGPRYRSVFTPPPLAAVSASTYGEAKQIAHALSGKGITQQAWHLLPKMLDVVAHWQRQPDRVREVHPECSFRAMQGRPLLSTKTTWAGLCERLRLLRDQGIELVAEGHDVDTANPDDVVDAAAVAWTAHRIASGVAASLPHPPEYDTAGRPVAIWY